MNPWIAPLLGLIACSTVEQSASGEPVLDGPPRVRVDRYGPVPAPRVLAASGIAVDAPSWTVTEEDVAEVQGTSVHAIGPGQTRVVTEVDGHALHWTLVVEPSIALTFVDPPDQVRVDEMQTLVVEGRMDDQVVEPGPIAWSSSHEEIAVVEDDGTVTGQAPGVTYVTVKGATGQAMLELRVVED